MGEKQLETEVKIINDLSNAWKSERRLREKAESDLKKMIRDYSDRGVSIENLEAALKNEKSRSNMLAIKLNEELVKTSSHDSINRMAQVESDKNVLLTTKVAQLEQENEYLRDQLDKFDKRTGVFVGVADYKSLEEMYKNAITSISSLNAQNDYLRGENNLMVKQLDKIKEILG